MGYVKPILTTLLAIRPISSSVEASASTTQGLVKFLYSRQSDSLNYVEINAAVSGRPACAAGTTYYIIRAESSDVGKSQFAMLMSAYLSRVPVRIYGAGTCVRWVDGEDIDAVAYPG